MINPFKDTNWKPDREELRGFGRSLIWGLPIMAVVFVLLIHWRQHLWVVWPAWMAGVGAVAGLLFTVVPGVARPVYLGWYFVACCIGIVLSNVVVSLVFYIVIFPVGLLLRMLGKDPMRRKFDRAVKSYWLEAEKIDDAKSYFRQF